tara:strand:+ start:356 stop:790 length:435 start_codon:yes stop_codon:yes gene_type:complete
MNYAKQCIVVTILFIFPILDWIVKSANKNNKAYKQRKLIMEKTYYVMKILLMYIEHIAIFCSGILFYKWLKKRKASIELKKIEKPLEKTKISTNTAIKEVMAESKLPVIEEKEIIPPPAWIKDFMNVIREGYYNKYHGGKVPWW